MTGNHAYGPPSVRFLLDESLVPAVAQALQLVEYDILDVPSAFGKEGTTDPELIDWCSDNAAVWIHADDRARKRHRALLQTSGIRTLWVYRKRGAMSAKEQLRVLSSVLPRLLRKIAEQPAMRHYRASAANEESAPSLRPISI